MFDSFVTATTGAHGAAAVDAWARVENAACARRVAAMAAMLDAAYTASGSASRDQWCIDNWDAVVAHVGAAEGITRGTAEGFLLTALALRDRFPKVGAQFHDGLITYQLARTIVTRGAQVLDPQALRDVDAALAAALTSWGPMSGDRTAKTIDALIAQHDPHAVRRTQNKARDRSVDVVIEDGSGLAQVFATLFTHDAKAVDARLDAFAETVCPADPRTKKQRRADAMAAAMTGADRLACLCGTPDCPAAENPPASAVVVYVIAHADTITGSGGGAEPETPTAPKVPDDSNEYQDDGDGDEGEEASGGSDTAGECSGLDGEPPAMFTKPLREMNLAEALAPAPGCLASIRPAAIMGGQLLPGAIARRAALGARIIPVTHPGLAPPEPRYRPSARLASFVRCRDQTCRFPGCHETATNCDVDHTIPWPYGPTQASNLKALCRRHHLLKTFWGGENGWRERQLDDGTVIWTAPDGRTHTSAPGSRLLFPELSEPTAPVVGQRVSPAHTSGLTMPRRKTTRAQDRAQRIHRERELNRLEAEAEAEPTS